MTIEDEMEEDCKEEGIDAVEYVTLSQMQQRYSLLKAKLMLAKKFPFLQRSMFGKLSLSLSLSLLFFTLLLME